MFKDWLGQVAENSPEETAEVLRRQDFQIERLTDELANFSDLHYCDCCEGLFESINEVGGHNQCDTCTELANMTAEVTDLKSKIRQMQNKIDKAGGLALIQASHEFIRDTLAEPVGTDSGSPDPCAKGHDFVDMGTGGTARCRDCGELADCAETGASRSYRDDGRQEQNDG